MRQKKQLDHADNYVAKAVQGLKREGIPEEKTSEGGTMVSRRERGWVANGRWQVWRLPL